MIERLLAGSELNQDVDIAVGARFVAEYGPK